MLSIPALWAEPQQFHMAWTDPRLYEYSPPPAQDRPTKYQWEQHRDLITMLYIDEEMTVEQIVPFMLQNHGFRATMFKQRFQKWKVYKYGRVKERNANMSAIPNDQLRTHTLDSILQDSLSTAIMNMATPSPEPEDLTQSLPSFNAEDIIFREEPTTSTSTAYDTDIDFEEEQTDGSLMTMLLSQVFSFSPILGPSSGHGNVEHVLLYVRRYSESWNPCDAVAHHHYIFDAAEQAAEITTKIAGHCSHRYSPNQCERCTWTEFDYGLAMLEAGQVRAAFKSFHLGCSLARLLLSCPSKLFIRNLIMAFGSSRWEAYEPVRRALLSYLARMAFYILPKSHPITHILKTIVFDHTLQASAEFSLKIMIEVFEQSIGTAHPDVLLIKRSLSVILRRQNEFEVSEAILRDAIQVSEHQLGNQHKETRRCLRRLVHLYMQKGQLDEAEKICQQILDSSPAHKFPPEAWIPDEISVYTYHHLAQITNGKGEFEECRRWFVAELDAAIRRWGSGGEYSADCMRVALQEHSLTPEKLSTVIDNYPQIFERAQSSNINRRLPISKWRWCAVRNLI